MARKKKHIAAGCLFWSSLVIVLAIAAIAARGPIEKAFGSLFGAKPTVVVTPLSDKAAAESPPPAEKPAASSTVSIPSDSTPSTSSTGTSKPAAESGHSSLEAPAEKPKTPQEKPVVRKTILFFTGVDAAGKLILKSAIRTIPASDSPLRDTLLTMISGPTSQEVNMGLISMIPSTTKLLGVVVRGDVAYIDFSEGFRFNTHGREGLDAQLKQVVYAATEYPTVKKVQILIEGKKVEYLGPEGIRIYEPLGRQSFPE
jgi:germination protein M